MTWCWVGLFPFGIVCSFPCLCFATVYLGNISTKKSDGAKKIPLSGTRHGIYPCNESLATMNQKIIIAGGVTVTTAAGLSVLLMPFYSDMGKARREAVQSGELEKAPHIAPGSVRR
jgi:hypothetical protein